jgi:hypothetical protein
MLLQIASTSSITTSPWLGGADMFDSYYQTVYWLQDANNGGSLFINRMADICTGRSGGATLLARAEEEGDLQVSYALVNLKYYKYSATDDVSNHI